MINTPLVCPCHSTKSYQSCCQLLHDGKVIAGTAEQLMRSRYSAFVMANITYLIATLHPDKRHTDDEAILQRTIKETHWLGSSIIHHQSSGNSAVVEFVAFYDGKPIGQLHERSRFIKQDKQWLYVDGEMLAPIKVSRNDRCFCGSGKKIKKCHVIL